MTDKEPEDEKRPILDEPTPRGKRFISVAMDAIMDEYTAFKNPNLPLHERVWAAQRLLSTALEMLQQRGQTEIAKKLRAFLKAYQPPRMHVSITRTTSDISVYRLYEGGATESTIDVAIQDLQAGVNVVKNQMYQEDYKVHVQVVGKVMVILARLGIIDEKTPSLFFSFSHLTAPLSIDGDEDELSETPEQADEPEEMSEQEKTPEDEDAGET